MRNQNEKLNTYLGELYLIETAAMKKAKAFAEELNKGGMSLDFSEGLILQFFSRLTQAKKIVEIGTLTGYSTLFFVNPALAGQEIWTFELNENHAKLAEQAFALDELARYRIKLQIGPALENLNKLSEQNKGPFDLIFIDADKGAYLDYLNWAEKNLASGGMLIADNTLLDSMVFDDEVTGKRMPFSKNSIAVMKEFNKRLTLPLWQSLILPTHSGLSVALRQKSF